MKDKVVLIVGGTGGIGSATARLFSKAGCKVVIAGRDKSKADEIAKNINDDGGEAFSIQVDVTDHASVSDMAREIQQNLGSIDILVNAFGQGLIQPILDINPVDAKEIIDVNVYGSFLVTQTVMRYMTEQKSGAIVMFPGTMGKYIMKNSSVYAATKFALTGFTKALTEEAKRTGIKFSLLHLGGVNTPFWDDERVNMRVKKEAMLDTEEVAKAVYYAVNQPEGSVLNEVVIQPESHQLV